MSITEIKQRAAQEAAEGEIHVQLTRIERKTTKTQKPYFEVEVADGCATEKLKVWENGKAFAFIADCGLQSAIRKPFVALRAMWSVGQFGMEGDFAVRLLSAEEKSALLEGTPERRELLAQREECIRTLVDSMQPGAVKEVCLLFLRRFMAGSHEEQAGSLCSPFLRAAAARGFHHARRGGLIEHTALMMAAANALCLVYDDVDRDMVLAGALLHDLGKMWENQYEAEGFEMPYTARAELFGHISIGVEVVRGLWREIKQDGKWQMADGKGYEDFQIDLLCHCILAHHGTNEWGSPVEPKTMEAQLLHFIDNIDAKLEMMRCAFRSEPEVGRDVIRAPRPLRGCLVRVGKQEQETFLPPN